MSKFITPVCMQVAQKQYENDLKQSLLDLGYEETYITAFNRHSYLCTNWGAVNNLISNGDYSFNTSPRYYIENYNPQLFLALAAMTDDPNGIEGEWWVCINIGATVNPFTKGKLYQQQNSNIKIGRPLPFINDNGNKDTFSDNKNHFRKATKEELIKHFEQTSSVDHDFNCFLEAHNEMTEEVAQQMVDACCVKAEPSVLPESWYIRVTEENHEAIVKWRGSAGSITTIGNCVRDDKWSYRKEDNPSIFRGYEEITFEQFKKYLSDMEHPFRIKGAKLPKLNGIKIYYSTHRVFRNEGNTFIPTTSKRWSSNHISFGHVIDNQGVVYIQFDLEDYDGNNYFLMRETDLEEIAMEQNIMDKVERECNTKESRFPFKLKAEDAQKIIDIACSGWKQTLAVEHKWAENIVLKKDIEISEEFYKQMRKACTNDQNILFDKIFGKDTVECEFKVGDYIVYEGDTFYFDKIMGDKIICRPVVNNLQHSDNPCNSINMISERFNFNIEHVNKHAELWSLKHTKQGEAIFLTVSGAKACLRYCDGKGGVYGHNRKSGDFVNINNPDSIRPFDMLNLPVNE